MSTDTYFTHLHLDATHPAPPSHPAQRSVGQPASRLSTFPPLYLDPQDARYRSALDASNPPVLGSTYYHHPALTRLVSHFLSDSSAHPLSSSWLNGADEADELACSATEATASIPRPRLESEYIALNEDLVPAPLDWDSDTLPADQHASYPFGNLFGPNEAGSSEGIVNQRGGATWASTGLSGLRKDAGGGGGRGLGGLDLLSGLGISGSGRRGVVSNSWNDSINRASKTKLVGSGGGLVEYGLEASQHTASSSSPWDDPDEGPSGPSGSGSGAAAPPRFAPDPNRMSRRERMLATAQSLHLSPFLLFRSASSSVLAPPAWPFRRYGPGSTSYSALLRPCSNIHGDAPAAAAATASLGGLPASAKIVKEVWSDLAMEELVPRDIGPTAATRGTGRENADLVPPESDYGGDGAGRKRKRLDTDAGFARRIATMEPDPLDRLGGVAREIRGQASVVWGASTRSSRRGRRRAPSQDYAEEAHVDPTFARHDETRYSFSLAPPPLPRPVLEGMTEVAAQRETDAVGYETAQHIFLAEERDRVLPFLALRGGGEYRVRGLRANRGIVPRPGDGWGPLEEAEGSREGEQADDYDKDEDEDEDEDEVGEDSRVGDGNSIAATRTSVGDTRAAPSYATQGGRHDYDGNYDGDDDDDGYAAHAADLSVEEDRDGSDNVDYD
ncbi:hypothetical protein ACQY0O_007921 [Thecaphora frezii]